MIQCVSSHALFGKVNEPNVAPWATLIVVPHAALLMAVCRFCPDATFTVAVVAGVALIAV
jgi:hypothetical protein